MKVLSCNAGYFLDYEGAYHEYMMRPHRGLVGDRAAESRAIERLVGVIEAEQPDVVGLLEVDQGSIRTRTDGQVSHVAARLAARGLTYEPFAATKYGDDGVIPSLPMLSYLANGVLVRDQVTTRTEAPARTEATTRAHYLDTGPKRLVIEVSLPEVDIFSAHLAMSGRARRKQLHELAALVREREHPVVAGDFNAYNGFEEVERAFERTSLELYDPGETVPPRPLDSVVLDTRTLDFFLLPASFAVSRCETIDVQVSDHRPIVLEFEPR